MAINNLRSKQRYKTKTKNLCQCGFYSDFLKLFLKKAQFQSFVGSPIKLKKHEKYFQMVFRRQALPSYQAYRYH